MPNAVDFDKIRKRRQRTATVKRLLVLTGVVAVIGCAIFAYNVILKESIVTGLSDYFESMGGIGFPADLPGGVIRDVSNIGENLTVLNDTSLYIYNPKAKVIQNIQQMTDHTIVKASNSRLFTFSVGSKDFSVHSLSRPLFSMTMELGVLCGAINQNGDFAVVAPVKEFASKVYVFDRHFDQIYSWSSPEYVTGVSLSPGGDLMAVSCMTGGTDGVLETLIYIFRFAESRETAEVAQTIGDSICMGIEFVGEDAISLLTDTQYMLLNSSGEIIKTYDFDGRSLLARETLGTETLLLFARNDRNESELVLLDENLKEINKHIFAEKIIDLALGTDTVYVLTAEGIMRCTREMEPVSEYERRGISEIHLVGERLYYLTYNQICVLE